MIHTSRLLLALMLIAMPVQAATQLEHRLSLPDGRLIHVQQPLQEPYSMGSLSIRLYVPMDPAYPFDNFINGLIIPRDGSLERLDLYDLDGDGIKELIIVCRTVGTGNYQAAYAFTIAGTIVVPYATVTNIPPEEQVYERLKRD